MLQVEALLEEQRSVRACGSLSRSRLEGKAAVAEADKCLVFEDLCPPAFFGLPSGIRIGPGSSIGLSKTSETSHALCYPKSTGDDFFLVEGSLLLRSHV